MIRGQKVFDADTHIHPSVESLLPYFEAGFRERIPELEPYQVPARSDQTTTPREDPSRHHYAVGLKPYRRVLGESEPAQDKDGHSRLHWGKYSGHKLPGVGVIDDRIEERLSDMNEESTDVHMMVPDVGIGVATLGDPTLEMGLIRAYHRWVHDYCNTHPGRFMALLVVSGTDVEGSVQEIERWGKEGWSAGLLPFPGLSTPMDHPILEPLWKAAAENDLPVLHHSMTWVAPFFPGYRDMDDNRFLARLCSHPWGAMKFVASFMGSGALDRYPNLRCGILESGVGWLPYWIRRMDEQQEYVGFTANLSNRISKYISDGRFGASIEMTEEEDMISNVISFLGDEILMYASDYPHAECEFPNSPTKVLGWESIPSHSRPKLMWQNAAKFFGH
mgnify:CR=1 FL=1